MRIIEQFSRIKYDLSVSRVPVTFLHMLTMVIVLILQWNSGMNFIQGAMFMSSSMLFSVLYWYSVLLYNKIKSAYFALQGLLIVVSVLAVPNFAILVLITFGAILVVQSFYFFKRMREFLSFLAMYLLYGSVILYFSYGLFNFSFYLLLFFLTLVLVFLVLTIFNQKELENMALAAANERIEQLTRQNERQRMARDLHDSLIQKLIALNLKMDVIEAHAKKGRYDKAETVITMAKMQVAESIAEARKVVDDLRLNMGDLPFRERLFEEVQQLQFIYNLKTELSILLETEVSQQLGNNVIALVKEAVTNVYKHANATIVTIQFIEKSGVYELMIADNGDGIDVQSALTKDKHYGLLGIKERVALFDGSFSIRNEDGTKLLIQFPVER